MTQAVLGVWALAIVVLGVLRPRWLPATAAVMCVFEGTALFKAGIAISPYYLCVLLVAVRCPLTRVTRDTWLATTPAARRAMATMLAFTVVAVAGAVVLPRVFAGVEVMSPRLSETGTASLVFSASNVGQALYLTLSLLLMWWAARQPRQADMARSIRNAIVVAGVIVVGMGLYQFAAAFTGLPFPDDVLYSNDAMTMQNNTSIGDMPRISSTFTEPAGMAVFLTGLIAFLTSDAGRASGGVVRVPLLVGATAVTLLSTSTTAYVGLGAVGFWRLGPSLLLPLLRGKLSLKSTLLSVGAAGLVVGAVALSPDLRELIQKMVFEKDQSTSYDERKEADAFGWQLVVTTFGLGTGLGSNRASAFLPSLFSTVGVYGGLLLALTVWRLTRPPADADVRPTHTAFSAFLLGVLVAKIISGPDLSTLSMWVMFAALLVTQAVPEAAVVPAVNGPAEPAPAAPARRRFVESSFVPQAGAGA